MLKFYRNISLFLLPVFLLLVLLPVSKQAKFQGLKNDCFNHGSWIYDRIFRQKKATDLIFLGSSKTINGIDDKLIEAKLFKHQLTVANLGYCRLGRNFSYALLKEVLDKKQVTHVVLEVREKEDRYSHPIFPYIARTEDVLFPNPFFNRDILADIWTHFAYKIALSQDILYTYSPTIPVQSEVFGYSSLKDTADLELLRTHQTKQLQQQANPNNLERSFYLCYPRIYLQKIHQLCEQRGITLTFLYLPSYGSRFDQPSEMATYQQYGAVLIPPDTILQEPAYWYDVEHFNQTGAAALSLWLAKELAK